MSEPNVQWMDETVESVPGKQGYYRLMCIILLKKRLTYNNMYVLTYAFHKRKFKNNELELKKKIITELAALYFYNNKVLPDGFEFTTDETNL